MISETERRFLDAANLDLPWGLVETFSAMPRWMPEDVNRAADVITQRVQTAGVPIEVYEPEICLSIPLHAEVRADGKTVRAKPPSSALSVPEGRTAKLVKLAANPHALRSYNRDIA